jgi:hypothetical protein
MGGALASRAKRGKAIENVARKRELRAIASLGAQ